MVATCDALGCNYSCKNNPGLSFRRIPAVNAQNKLIRKRLIQNIHRAFPFSEDENFFIC